MITKYIFLCPSCAPLCPCPHFPYKGHRSSNVGDFMTNIYNNKITYFSLWFLGILFFVLFLHVDSHYYQSYFLQTFSKQAVRNITLLNALTRLQNFSQTHAVARVHTHTHTSITYVHTRTQTQSHKPSSPAATERKRRRDQALRGRILPQPLSGSLTRHWAAESLQGRRTRYQGLRRPTRNLDVSFLVLAALVTKADTVGHITRMMCTHPRTCVVS